MSGFEALLTGRVLADRYRIEEVIGRGGMGAVYRGTDERLGRPVAVKVITAAAGSDPEARDRIRARFRHEAASAARLPHHPNVVPVYDYGTDATLGLDFLVMELLRGEDLASRLQRRGPPPLAVALRILEQAARGVSVGHRQGLIHRDVKPGNVYLVEDHEPGQFQVRVLDFGIAKMVADEDTATALTMDGRAPLSPAYASPEQLRGEQRLTPASDVFSLGAMGFQLLTATRAFTEQDRNRMSLGMEVPVPSLRARAASVPEEVEAVVRRAMAHDPAQRYPTAGALADALDAVLRHLQGTPAASAVPPAPGAAPPPPPLADDDRTVLAGEDDRTMLAPAAAVAAAGAPAVTPPAPAPLPPRSRPAAPPPRSGGGAGRVALVVGLVGAVAAGGWFVVRSMDDPAGDAPPLSTLPDTAGPDTTQVVEPPVDPGVTDALAAFVEGRRLIGAANPGEAIPLLERAVRLVPENAEYRDLLGVAYLQTGRFEEALGELQRARQLDPELAVAYSHLAQAQAAVGDTAGAVGNLQAFLQRSTDAPARRAAQELLQRLTAPPAVVPVPTPGPAAPADTVRLPTGPADTIRIRNDR